MNSAKHFHLVTLLRILESPDFVPNVLDYFRPQLDKICKNKLRKKRKFNVVAAADVAVATPIPAVPSTVSPVPSICSSTIATELRFVSSSDLDDALEDISSDALKALSPFVDMDSDEP